MSGEGMQLFDAAGRRKYLTAEERERFLTAAEAAPRESRTLPGARLQSGCRLSEALALTAEHVDLTAGTLVFESLKKRRTWVYRAVPVPLAVIDALGPRPRSARPPAAPQGAHGAAVALEPGDGLAPSGRGDAPRRPRRPAGHAKGLRHGFGVQAVSVGIPLNLVQKWLGHAHLSTTAFYADAVGADEKQIAARMW